MNFYNHRQPHQAMDNQTSMAAWRVGMKLADEPAEAGDMPLRLDKANALPTMLIRQRAKRPTNAVPRTARV